MQSLVRLLKDADTLLCQAESEVTIIGQAIRMPPPGVSAVSQLSQLLDLARINGAVAIAKLTIRGCLAICNVG